jgi:CDP-diglyceride synthetase
MLSSHFSVPLFRLVALFITLLILGILLVLPMYRFNYHRFIHSKLFIKITLWIPIFLIFVCLLYLSNTARLTVFVLLLAFCLSELLQILGQSKGKQHAKALIIYFLLFSASFLHFYIIGAVYHSEIINLLIIIGFSSVLSDVTAFFLGNYRGKHKLPSNLNPQKSWEGVFGQVIGALIGILLVNSYITPVPTVWLFLPIGVGSAAGDLINSYMKRLVHIKDWSNNIPGHGGYLDRLSSLAGSAILTFYYLKLFGVV